MRHTNTKNVPRESFLRRVGGLFTRIGKAFGPKRSPEVEIKCQNILNARVTGLSPYLLRDIGFRDAQVQCRRK